MLGHTTGINILVKVKKWVIKNVQLINQDNAIHVKKNLIVNGLVLKYIVMLGGKFNE
jgi:hypothetical protein